MHAQAETLVFDPNPREFRQGLAQADGELFEPGPGRAGGGIEITQPRPRQFQAVVARVNNPLESDFLLHLFEGAAADNGRDEAGVAGKSFQPGAGAGGEDRELGPFRDGNKGPVVVETEQDQVRAPDEFAQRRKAVESRFQDVPAGTPSAVSRKDRTQR